MNAAIIERNWVVEWFDERQCYHMPSLTMAPDGTLLAVWNGGFLQWNGDPMGRDAKDWVSVLEPGAEAWSNPDSSRAQKAGAIPTPSAATSAIAATTPFF